MKKLRPVPILVALTCRTRNPKPVSALHAWIDAQRSDHGTDSMAGHEHHRCDMTPPARSAP